ncbi:tripartite tricarboxylate transporter permease [Desulfosporosinus sp. FKB]|uniref:tripartite tricarboxylate transporter permease n=1 Tax=Desulfosporosinus sp. FKB TaxID=1969835 RepID=UPI000B49B783|nr:tripartite tricarboxylate transporter permease [Desulfosporosinus sp. FKB]
MNNLMMGLLNVVSPFNLLAVAAGTALGLFVGAMPGLSATMAIALLLPVTFGMDPATGISMLAALYMGAMYGGSISAILIRTPGTPAAAATVMDGYPMAQQGRAGKALGVSLTASLIGGVLSSIALLTIAPLLGKAALSFGPVELFAIAVLGMTIIGSLSSGSPIKGILSGVAGLLIAMIGMDPISGVPRFTFGTMYLFNGVSYVVALIGLFSIPQALRLVEKDDGSQKAALIKDRMLPTWKELKSMIVTILRSSVIGIFTGLIPGTGGDTACWFGYNEAKRFSKEKEKFGTGYPEGVAASEAANNAVVGGALVPTITLGIPGSSATAILLGGLMVHGIMPGPTLMTDHAQITYTLIWAVMLSNIFMFLEGLVFTRAAVSVTKVPNKVLAPIIVILCVIGSFTINNSINDVFVMIGFGILGYFMDKLDIPTAPMVVGMILGMMLDNTMRQSLLMSSGKWSIFLSSPLSTILLIIALLSLLQSTPIFAWLKKALFKKNAPQLGGK